MTRSAVPAFYLYGEPHRGVDPHFIHVERLDDRSRPGSWRIRPHLHPDLHQILHISRGAGTLSTDGATYPFRAPCLLIAPAGVVHGFAFEPESIGVVATLASSHAEGLVLRDPALAPVFAAGAVLQLGGDAATASSLTAQLLREHGWAVPGHRAAIDAGVTWLLVLALRRGARAVTGHPVPGPAARLVARYREYLEQHFRRRDAVAVMADALGITPGALASACARVANTSPAAMVDARAVLEAKRALVYADLPVARIGYSLGFTDPAYFSRFFARHAGCSPSAYRLERRGRGPDI